MQMIHRRGGKLPESEIQDGTKANVIRPPSPRETWPPIVLIVVFLSVSFLVWLEFRQSASTTRLLKPILSSSTKPDNERVISKSILPHEDEKPTLFKEQIIACMPTVSRQGVEYISNAVKSWRLATNGSESIRRLAIFDMDVNTTHQSHPYPTWLHRVFESPGAQLPSWLEIHQRAGKPVEPRVQTLGDSTSRIAWRSKEAQDYAQVLDRCLQLAAGDYVVVVQDDVLFTRGMRQVVDWSNSMLVEQVGKDERGRDRIKRVCGGSLFDIPREEHKGVDGHELDSLNMVARIWRIDYAHKVVRYINANFDEAPVDWLVDRLCKGTKRVTRVMEPNAVRHRGAISSYADNKREGLLT